MKKNVVHINKGFTSSDGKYNDAIQYWHRRVMAKLSNASLYNIWIENKDKDGKEIKDGNPIYSLINKEKTKAIRIMQIEPRSNSPYISAWIEEFDDGRISFPVLAIGLELSQTTLIKSLDLIEYWFSNNLTKVNFLIQSIKSQFEKNYVKSDFEKILELRNDIEELKSMSSINVPIRKHLDIETIEKMKKVYFITTKLESDYYINISSIIDKSIFVEIYQISSAIMNIVTIRGAYKFGHGYNTGNYAKRFSKVFYSTYKDVNLTNLIISKFNEPIEKVSQDIQKEMENFDAPF